MTRVENYKSHNSHFADVDCSNGKRKHNRKHPFSHLCRCHRRSTGSGSTTGLRRDRAPGAAHAQRYSLFNALTLHLLPFSLVSDLHDCKYVIFSAELRAELSCIAKERSMLGANVETSTCVVGKFLLSNEYILNWGRAVAGCRFLSGFFQVSAGTAAGAKPKTVRETL